MRGGKRGKTRSWFFPCKYMRRRDRKKRKGRKGAKDSGGQTSAGNKPSKKVDDAHKREREQKAGQ